MPYTHRVKANVGDKQYSLPVNLTTINEFFGSDFNSEEAEQFIASQADSSIETPVTFIDQAMKFVGRELYEARLIINTCFGVARLMRTLISNWATLDTEHLTSRKKSMMATFKVVPSSTIAT